MPPRLTLRLRLLSLVALAASTLPAHGWSRVTLRNGFTYDCAREQPVDSLHTRLFLTSQEDSSYVEVATAEIVSVDDLPQPPAVVPTPAPAPTAVPSPDLGTLLATAGSAHNIDVELLASIVHAESGGRTRAVSRTGARGLMQLMPATAHQLGVLDSFEPGQNIRGGTAFLDALLTRFHNNLALTLAAYNAGPGAVDRFHGIPPYPETRAYVARVMTEFKRRKAALPAQSAHPVRASR